MAAKIRELVYVYAVKLDREDWFVLAPTHAEAVAEVSARARMLPSSFYVYFCGEAGRYRMPRKAKWLEDRPGNAIMADPPAEPDASVACATTDETEGATPMPCPKPMPLVLYLLVMLALFLPFVGGCQPQAGIDGQTLGSAQGRSNALEKDLVGSGADADAIARHMEMEIEAGLKATPANNVEAQKRWHGMEVLLESFRAFGAKMVSFSKDVVVIKADLVKAEQERIAQAADARAQLKALQAKLDASESTGTQRMRTIQWIAVAGVPAAIIIGLLLFHDFRISVIGVFASLVTILVAQFTVGLSHMGKPFIIICSSVVAAGVAWICVQAYRKGSLTDAVKHNWLDEVRDAVREMFHHGGGEGKGVAVVSTGAGTTAVSGDVTTMPSPTPAPDPLAPLPDPTLSPIEPISGP